MLRRFEVLAQKKRAALESDIRGFSGTEFAENFSEAVSSFDGM